MEEKNHCGDCCSKGGVCGMSGSGFGCVNKIFFLRWFLGIIIIMLVFCLGVQLGEVRSELGKGYYRHGMSGAKMMMISPNVSYSDSIGY